MFEHIVAYHWQCERGVEPPFWYKEWFHKYLRMYLRSKMQIPIVIPANCQWLMPPLDEEWVSKNV